MINWTRFIIHMSFWLVGLLVGIWLIDDWRVALGVYLIANAATISCVKETYRTNKGEL